MTLSPLLTAATALFLFLAVHIVIWNWIRKKGLILLLLIAFASFCAVALWQPPFSSIDIRSSLPIYCLGILAYLHWYIGTFRSVSVRILEETMRAGGRISLATLDGVYPKKWMLESRLDVLTQHRWITRDDATRFRLTRKGAFFASLIAKLRSLYGIEHAG